MNATERHEQFFNGYFHPVTLAFDREGRLREWAGETAFYPFLRELSPGQSGETLLPFLVGLDTRRELYLPYLTLTPGITIDAYLVPAEDDGFWVHLVDTSGHRRSHQDIQQVANDISLFNESLVDLSSELQARNAALLSSDRARGDFIASMSHEFKTPISCILGHSELLRRSAVDEEGTRHSLQNIERSARYLLALIDNLLNQRKLEAGELEVHPRPVAVAEMVRNIVDMFEPEAGRKCLELWLEERVAPDLRLALDEVLVTQALYNVIGNAIKYTERGSVRLTIDWDARAERLRLRVSDTGIGIPADEMDQIFRSFTRASNARHQPGTGLGLATTHEIVQRMDGELHIDSEMGRGTTVTIELPAPAVREADRPGHAPPVERPVLLIEDSEDLVDLYTLFLEEAGFHVAAVLPPSLARIHAVLEAVNPALVIVDHDLGGGLTGLEVIRFLHKRGVAAPVVMLTASAGSPIKQQAAELGCRDYLVKPVSGEELARTARRFIPAEAAEAPHAGDGEG